jgi:signal transduction histidine kinase
MEQTGDKLGILDLMDRPAFCVEHGMIRRVNDAARRLMIDPDTAVQDLLATGKLEYGEFTSGCLYLSLQIAGRTYGASVTRMDAYDVFLLEHVGDNAELQAMALAAQELRGPLSSIMTSADQLFPLQSLQDDPQAQEQASRMNRGLFQMLRIISNMSDAARYSSDLPVRQEVRDIPALTEEIFRKAQALLPHTNLELQFTNWDTPVYTLVDPEKLERALYNMLSNAMKFTPSGGVIRAKLSKRGDMLYLSLQDSGSGITESLRGNVYTRYLRAPGIEDSRHGIGLGMVLIRSAAANHGGTVLIDHPEDGGTRITMTLAIRQGRENRMRSPVFRIDYAGERDHTLIELSDALPAKLYDSKSVN